MTISSIINAIKMLYKILCWSSSILSFAFNSLWNCCNFVTASVPWLSILLAMVFVVSKFVKVKLPDAKHLRELLGGQPDEEKADCVYWSIANKGGGYDAPENSFAAIKNCIAQNCRNIMLDLSITSCGELVLLHKSTLEKAYITDPISQVRFDSLENFNISEHHPLGSRFPPEKVLSLASLLTLLENLDLTVFLLLSSTEAKCLDALKSMITRNPNFTKNIVICSTSPWILYQLRKFNEDLLCGLWIERTQINSGCALQFCIPHIFQTIEGTLLRHLFVPVIGVNVAFIHKDEFNLNTSVLWKNVGVRPIVYPVNLPTEKRYFQKVIKTQYLTDSLRSEPQLPINSN